MLRRRYAERVKERSFEIPGTRAGLRKDESEDALATARRRRKALSKVASARAASVSALACSDSVYSEPLDAGAPDPLAACSVARCSSTMTFAV